MIELLVYVSTYMACMVDLTRLDVVVYIELQWSSTFELEILLFGLFELSWTFWYGGSLWNDM